MSFYDLVGVTNSCLHSLGGLADSALHALFGALCCGGCLVGHLGFLVPQFNLLGLACLDLVGAVLLDKGSEVLNGPRAAVVNGRVLLAGWEELDGGEALNLIGNIVGGGVDFSDGNEFSELGGGVEGGKLFVLGSETGDKMLIQMLV